MKIPSKILHVARPKLPRFAKLEYWVWDCVLSFAFFYTIYVALQYSAPNDLWKFLAIFGNSVVTGIAGSLVSSWRTGYWPWGSNLNHVLKFLLVSLVQTTLVFYSVYGILISEMTWDRVLINVMLVMVTVKMLAYAIALKVSMKVDKFTQRTIMGKRA